MKSENPDPLTSASDANPDPRARNLDEWVEIQSLCDSLVEAGGNFGAAYRAAWPVVPIRRL